MISYFAICITILLAISPFVFKKALSKWRRARALRTLAPDERQMITLVHRGDFAKFKDFVGSIKFNPDFRDPITKGNLLMLCASDDRKAEFVKYLIQKGCDVNAVDKKGSSIMFVTTYWNCPQLFNIIVNQKNVDIDKSTFAHPFEMNPLSACVFKSRDMIKHLAEAKRKSNNTEAKTTSEAEEDPILAEFGNPYYRYACQLLHHGASTAKCRQIMDKYPDQYHNNSYDRFDKLLSLFERWHGSKKVLLLDYYLAKQGRKKFPVENKKFFALEKLPPTIISKIADLYL